MGTETTPAADLLTLDEVAARLRYAKPESALRALRRRGAKLVRVGGPWLVPRSELDRILASSVQP